VLSVWGRRFRKDAYRENAPSISVSYLKTTKAQFMDIGGNALFLRYLSEYLMGMIGIYFGAVSGAEHPSDWNLYCPTKQVSVLGFSSRSVE
jgi:hypothetical protein